MSDRDLESWLDRQIPQRPSADAEARLMARAEALLARRRTRRPSASGRWLAVAAGLLVLMAGATLVSLRVGDGERVLQAAGDGSFTVSGAARYQPPGPSDRLRLDEGLCTARAVEAPLAIAFPGGVLRVERGTGKVEVRSEGDGAMMRNGRKRVAWVLVTLVAGWGILELGDEAVELAAGEGRTLRIESPEDEPGKVIAIDVTDAIGDGETAPSDREDDAAGTDSQPETVAVDPPWRGRVVDAVTGEALAGAAVGWLESWRPGVQRTIVARQARSTIAVTHPGALIIGERMIQLPFTVDPDVTLRVETVSDGDGSYEIEASTGEGELLLVMADGYQPWFGSAGRASDAVEIRLDPRRRVVGRLVTADGAPLRVDATRIELRASIAIVGLEGWSCEWTVPLDATYGFEILAGTVDEAQLRVSAPSYHDVVETVPLRRAVTPVTLALEDHDHIRGRVTDPNANPLAGVNLLVKSGTKGFFRDDMNPVSAETDDRGEYIVNLYGPTVDISAQKDGYAPGEFTGVDPAAPFDLVLEPAVDGALRGVVVDARRQPLAGAEVQAVRSGIGFVRNHRTETDADGTFLLEGLPPGRYRVSARPAVEGGTIVEKGWGREPRGAAHLGVERDGIVVGSGLESGGLELVVPDGGTVFGSYFAEDGEAVGDERIALYRPSLVGGDHQLLRMVLTDDRGEFAFHGVAPGMYAVAVERLGGYRLVRIDGGEGVEVHLGGATSALAVRVFRGDEPVAGAEVALGRLERTVTDTRLGMTTDDGSFSFDGLARGRYMVHVRDRQSGTVLLSTVDIDRTEVELELDWPATTVTVRVVGAALAAGTTMELRLTGFDGVPLEGVVPAPYLLVARAVTSDGTSFRFEGISAGSYRAAATGDRTVSCDVRVGRFDVEVEAR